MGTYNNVHWFCPGCGAEQCRQTKAGSCTLKNIRITSVPLADAGEMVQGKHTCSACNAEVVMVPNRTTINITPTLKSEIED